MVRWPNWAKTGGAGGPQRDFRSIDAHCHVDGVRQPELTMPSGWYRFELPAVRQVRNPRSPLGLGDQFIATNGRARHRTQLAGQVVAVIHLLVRRAAVGRWCDWWGLECLRSAAGCLAGGAQPAFFVAMAPLAASGSVNCSPEANRGEFAFLGG